MKTTHKFVLIVACSLLLLGPGIASAIPPGSDSPQCADLASPIQCEDQLANLCAATGLANSLKTRDRDTLVSKVLGAAVKLDQGKPLDADQKLEGYESTLTSLINAPKPKISEDDANSLSSALTSARMCVDTIFVP